LLNENKSSFCSSPAHDPHLTLIGEDDCVRLRHRDIDNSFHRINGGRQLAAFHFRLSTLQEHFQAYLDAVTR